MAIMIITIVSYVIVFVFGLAVCSVLSVHAYKAIGVVRSVLNTIYLRISVSFNVLPLLYSLHNDIATRYKGITQHYET